MKSWGMDNKTAFIKLRNLCDGNGIKLGLFPSKKKCLKEFNEVPMGFADCAQRKIYLRPTLTEVAKVSTFTHEIAHILLKHKNQIPGCIAESKQEVEAETVERDVLKFLGITYSDGNLTKHLTILKRSKVKANRQKIRQVTKQIISALEE